MQMHIKAPSTLTTMVRWRLYSRRQCGQFGDYYSPRFQQL